MNTKWQTKVDGTRTGHSCGIAFPCKKSSNKMHTITTMCQANRWLNPRARKHSVRRVSAGINEGTQPDWSNKLHIDSSIFQYVIDQIREPDILGELRETTAVQYPPQIAQMAVSPEQGAFLRWLVEVIDAHRVIEVGVFTGYSSICMGMALQSLGGDRLLLALDKDEKALAIAREYWNKAGLVPGIIEERFGPAVGTLKTLIDEENMEGMFDFAFVDADKRAYREYYEILLKVCVW